MHEHLPIFGLINMNGRVYDPVTASFFSPDPYLQAPGNWLNYNRYTYCLNNPFKYTDPDGEWIWIVIGGFIGGTINWIAHGAQFTADGAAAFGIGFAGGVIASATGGAVLLSYGAVAGAGGFIGGAISAGVAYGFGTTATALANNAYFGDALPTWENFAIGMGISMLTGGLINGAVAASSSNNFWTGVPKPQPQVPNPDIKIPAPKLKEPDLKATLEKMRMPFKEMPINNAYELDNLPQYKTVQGDGFKLTIDNTTRDLNFRANLIKASGIDPGKAAQAHHIFPLQYGDDFFKAGIETNKYGAWWYSNHLNNAAAYNRAWGEFFHNVPYPTSQQVWQKALELKIEFGY
jgi:RHS repeat-associated protein